MFESRVLRRLFRSERNEVTGEWRKTLSEKLNGQYSSPNVSGDKFEKNVKFGACSKLRGDGWYIQGFVGQI